MAERVTTGLHFPTSIAFDSQGRPWVAESGLPFDGAPRGGRVAANAPRYAGHILVCLFGDERPTAGPPGPRGGRTLARMDVTAGTGTLWRAKVAEP